MLISTAFRIRRAKRHASRPPPQRGTAATTETSSPDTNRFKPYSRDASVETACLRTGERCISYSHHDTTSDIRIFADGKWTTDYVGTARCDDNNSFSTHFHSEFPLPQPPQDPITLLTGHAHNVATGSACAGTYDYEVKYERTGD